MKHVVAIFLFQQPMLRTDPFRMRKRLNEKGT